MTSDKVYKLIEDNGLTLHGDIEHFAELVARAEREACSKLVDHILKEGGGTWGDAIRARGRS